MQGLVGDAAEHRHPVWDEEQQRFVSRAQIAETTYTAFEDTDDAVTARLTARRIPDLNKTRVDAQGELFTVWRYHAAFTDSPLAHLPSGRFNANNAWLTCIAIAHNLTRAAATLAGPRYATARAATIRRHVINVAGRITRNARTITIHLPAHWPWQPPWQRLWDAAHPPNA